MTDPARIAWILLSTLLDYLPSIRTWTGAVTAGAARGPAPTRVVECRRCQGKGHSTPNRPCEHCDGKGRVAVDQYTGQPVKTETPRPRPLELAEIDRELARLEGHTGRDWTERRDGQWRHGSYLTVARELDRIQHDPDPLTQYAGWCVWTYVVCDQQVPLHDSTIGVIEKTIELIAARAVAADGEIVLPPWMDVTDDQLQLQRRRFLWRGHGPAAERARQERDEAMRQLRRQGVDVGEIGRQFGLSRSRTYEIVTAGTASAA